MKIIKATQLVENTKKILQEAPADTSKESNDTVSPPAEVVNLLNLLQNNPVNVIKAADDTYKFPSMPTDVRVQTRDLTVLLESDADSKLLNTKAREYAELMQFWYGPPLTNYVWAHKAATTKTKIKGLDLKELGNTIIGSILNRTAPTGGETNSSYDAFVTHLKNSVANARLCLGLGDKATRWTSSSDIINTIRCLYLSLDERKAFNDLYTTASAAAGAIAGYVNNIKEFSWSNDSRTTGPAIFKAAIEAADAFLQPYGGSISSALGNTLDRYNSGPAARKTAPEAYDKIANLISALNAVTDWISKEQSQDTAVAARQADHNKINSKGVNWGQLYDRAKSNGDTTEFFSQYFEGEWGDWAPNIQRLGKVFIQEVQSLGFSIQNPFIFYLKMLKANCEKAPEAGVSLVDVKSTVVNNLLKVYTAVHNAYVRGQLTSADLKGTGRLGPFNLIFCPAIFTQAQNPAAYLELQYNLLTQINAGNWTSSKLAVWGQDPIWCYTKFFYETEKTSHTSPDILDILELEDANNNGSTNYVEIIKNNRLRSTGIIKELFKAAFGEKAAAAINKDIDKTKNMSKSDLEDLIKKLSPESKETLKKLLGTS